MILRTIYGTILLARIGVISDKIQVLDIGKIAKLIDLRTLVNFNMTHISKTKRIFSKIRKARYSVHQN